MAVDIRSGQVDGETPSWPVTGDADLRLDSHPELRFTAVTDGHRCAVLALDDLIACGSLRWIIDEKPHDATNGMIGYVYVSAEYRRRGVATALLTAACAYAEHYGVAAPRHADERSPEGEAWARSLGAEPAARVNADIGHAHIPNIWDRVDDVLERYDSSIRLECASGCAWSGELRLTLTNPEAAPSRSMTFFSAGGADPDEVASALLVDAEAWLAESDQEPLPVPDWRR